MRAALLLVAVLLAPAASALDVPRLTGRVVDLGGVLDAATEAALVARLAAHEDSTSNQIVVLTIPSLDGEILEPYATRVFREWGLGQAGTDNGVLLLVAVADRELRIEVGYGLEAALTDATAGSIIRNEIVPRFRDGDFDAGVLAGTDAILLAVAGEYEASDSGGSDWTGMLIVLCLFVPWVAIAPLMNGGMDPPGLTRTTLGGLLTGVFLAIPAAEMFGWPWGAVGAVVLMLAVFLLANVGIERHPTLGPKRAHYRRKQEAFKRARKRGETTVRVDGRSYSVPTASSSDGGDYSGGGGSSGGGGASGSW